MCVHHAYRYVRICMYIHHVYKHVHRCMHFSSTIQTGPEKSAASQIQMFAHMCISICMYIMPRDMYISMCIYIMFMDMYVSACIPHIGYRHRSLCHISYISNTDMLFLIFGGALGLPSVSVFDMSNACRYVHIHKHTHISNMRNAIPTQGKPWSTPNSFCKLRYTLTPCDGGEGIPGVAVCCSVLQCVAMLRRV